MKQMRIIKTEEDNTNFILHLEDERKLTVSKETYFKYSLYELSTLSEAMLKEFQYKNDLINCEFIARKHLLGKIKSSNQLKLFLLNKNFSEEVIINIITKLMSENILDDVKYAKKLIKRKLKGNKISSNMLISILINEGISEKLSTELVDKEKISNYDNAKTIINQRYKGKINEREKIYRYLLSKGFEPEVILEVLGKEI